MIQEKAIGLLAAVFAVNCDFLFVSNRFLTTLVFPTVLLRQRKMWRRFNGVSVYCEDNGACIITARGDVKGSAINGPITKECSELWPPLATRASAVL